MAGFKEDTELVKEEFEGLSNSTQIFIWSLIGAAVLLGLLLGGAIGYGVSVEEIDGRDCIVHDDTEYCAGEAAA